MAITVETAETKLSHVVPIFGLFSQGNWVCIGVRVCKVGSCPGYNEPESDRKYNSGKSVCDMFLCL